MINDTVNDLFANLPFIISVHAGLNYFHYRQLHSIVVIINFISIFSMFKVQQELGELQQKHELLRSQLNSTARELQFLKRQHFESQENLAHLRASVSL